MNTKSITFISLMGMLTTITLAGSIWLWLYLAGPNSINPSRILPADNYALLAVASFGSYFCGGALWGLGIALLTKTDVKAMVKTCALSWGLTAFVFSASLGLSLGPIFRFGNTITLRDNYYYLLIIVPVIGIVTGINGWVVISKLGLKGFRLKASLKIGIAAALGFLAVSLFLQFVLGWEVGKPVPGKYAMLTLMHWCNMGAALAGGSVLGRELVESKSGLESTASANE
ncbi:MAG TPA: hypothetical protein VK851_10640 [Anaerolineales bacterium]|nr:hypothetical protein [Anaerolineales bacterium]